jgi:hypothetical protein
VPSTTSGATNSLDGNRNLNGRKEEFFLAMKVMMDERHVDPRVRRNAAQ